jgi:hypothetical protein
LAEGDSIPTREEFGQGADWAGYAENRGSNGFNPHDIEVAHPDEQGPNHSVSKRPATISELRHKEEQMMIRLIHLRRVLWT